MVSGRFMKPNPLLRSSQKAQMSAATYTALRKQVQQVLLLGQRKIEQAKVNYIVWPWSFCWNFVCQKQP